MKVTKYALPGIEKNKKQTYFRRQLVCHVTCPYISRHLKQKVNPVTHSDVFLSVPIFFRLLCSYFEAVSLHNCFGEAKQAPRGQQKDWFTPSARHCCRFFDDVNQAFNVKVLVFVSELKFIGPFIFLKEKKKNNFWLFSIPEILVDCRLSPSGDLKTKPFGTWWNGETNFLHRISIKKKFQKWQQRKLSPKC